MAAMSATYQPGPADDGGDDQQACTSHPVVRPVGLSSCGNKWDEADTREHLGIYYHENPSNYLDLLKKAQLEIEFAKWHSDNGGDDLIVPPEYDFDLDVGTEDMDKILDVIRLRESDRSDKTETRPSTIDSALLKITDYRKTLSFNIGLLIDSDLGEESHLKKRRILRSMAIEMFMKTFEKILRINKAGYCLSESCYVSLFQDFARIFSIQFTPYWQPRPVTTCSGEDGASSVVRKFCQVTVNGVEVVSLPDLVYSTTCKTSGDEISIVTVAEVKPTARKPEATSPACTRSRGPSDPSDDQEPPAKRPCPEFDTDFPSALRGQHATQLLFHRPHTSMKNGNCMLGLVVQATKVRLTCLDMKKDHLEHFHLTDMKQDVKKKKSNQRNESMKSTVYYTRAFDMINRKERGILIHILTTLAKNSHDLR